MKPGIQPPAGAVIMSQGRAPPTAPGLDPRQPGETGQAATVAAFAVGPVAVGRQP